MRKPHRGGSTARRITVLAAAVGLVASDSPLKDSSGAAVPFVGLDNKQSGTQVGQIAARLYGGLRWPAAQTWFADVEAPFQACLDRTNAEYQVFRRAHPELPANHVVKVPYNGLANKASDAMRATITAHPQAKYWVIASCNDAGVVGALRALRDKAVPVANVLGVGLGGDQACQAYTQSYISAGLRASTYLNPKAIGAGDIKVLYQIVVQKKTPPKVTYIPTPEINKQNYRTTMAC
jgi:L-arabinose transport system substrate-binding protein